MLSIVQVAIGLIFVYVLLSILATTVNTIVTNVLQTRAKNLRDELVNLITDPEVQQQVLTHPLIDLIRHDVPLKTGGIRALISPITSRLDKFLRSRLPGYDPNQMRDMPVNDVGSIDKETFAQGLEQHSRRKSRS